MIKKIASQILLISGMLLAITSCNSVRDSAKQDKYQVFSNGGNKLSENAIIEIFIKPYENKNLYKTAGRFGDILTKISGSKYKIVDSPFNGNGILLALEEDYTGKLKIPAKFTENAEAFVISSDKKSLTIIGKTDKAIQDGVYTYLHKLGCRWLVPGERWTIIPKRKDIFHNLELADAPDYRSRRIWYQYGDGWGELWNRGKISADRSEWERGNLQGSVAPFNTGHCWGSIVRRHKEEFDKHPEYFAMNREGKRNVPESKAEISMAKFCCSNSDLIKLVAEDRLQELSDRKKKNPDEFMISVEPSDGSVYCFCDKCQKLGSGKPSDMVVNLANGVIKYIRKTYPDAWVGFYAYSAHQDPPELKLEPHTYVQVAMAFNSTAYTLDELVEIWGKNADAIGLREYYGITQWTYGLPRGLIVNKVSKRIPKHYAYGATSISAESSNNWAPMGPGYSLAAALMWDVQTDIEKQQNDFFEKAFGKAVNPMRSLYDGWLEREPLMPEYIKSWMKKVEKADKLAKDPAVKKRINDMKSYLHFCVLYMEMEMADKGDPAREVFKELISYAYRIKSRNMLHSYALVRTIANGRFPSCVTYNLPEELKHKTSKSCIPPWCFSETETSPMYAVKEELTDSEIDRLFAKDVNKYRDAPQAKSFSLNFVVPPYKLEGCSGRNWRDVNGGFRGGNSFYALFDTTEMEIYFKSSKVATLVLKDIKTGEQLQKIMVRKDDKSNFTLKVPQPGVYKIVAGGWCTLKFPLNKKVVYSADARDTTRGPSPYGGEGYFYVPTGTKSFRVKFGSRMWITAPNEKRWKLNVTTHKTLVEIVVPKGCDGKLWKIAGNTAGAFSFFGIPPYLALTPDGYIGPEECFDK